MAPKSATRNKKTNTKASDNAGVVKKTARPTTVKNTAIIEAAAPRFITMKPNTATSTSKKPFPANDLPAASSTKSSPIKPNITKSSLRKRASSDIALSTPAASSTPSAPSGNISSDDAPSSPVKAKIAAFHEARGLGFEELHIGSDNNAASQASTESIKTPQKSSKKAPAKSSTKAPVKPPVMAPLQAPVKAAVTASASTPATAKPATRKRTRQGDDVQQTDAAQTDAAQTDATSTSPKLTLKLKRGSASTTPKPASTNSIGDGNSDTPPPAPKRVKITVGKKASTSDQKQPAAAPKTPATSTRASKAKSKGGPVITKNGKVKKAPEYAIEHQFDGTPSNHGYSIERPQFATLAQPWQCANLTCTTGMTWVPRDTKDSASGKGPMGRKVISQFFGRNKGPTKLIPNDVWHYYCRKDYQRHRYAAEHGTADALAEQVITNLRDQLVRLKLWRPDALFKVQLDKSATDRLSGYFALLRQHNNNEAAAQAALPAPKDRNKPKPEEIFPVSLAETFNRRFKTDGKDASANYDDIEAIIAWSEGEINAGRSTVFVPAEFLINEVQPGETVNDVSDNFARWEVVHQEQLRQAAAEAERRRANVNSSGKATTKIIDSDDTMIESSSESSASDTSDSEIPSTPTPRGRPLTQGSEGPMSIKRLLNSTR
ncbi:hypothetical protein Q7P37_009261 [Cladosporium fusiforme]